MMYTAHQKATKEKAVEVIQENPSKSQQSLEVDMQT